MFEQNKDDRCSVNFPQTYFDDLFSFFSQYNFTIDENDPYDSEIGIDPEMLGRVFESLLEDNKDKGAFYTPKEIVQYMCRQSISQYLKSDIPISLHKDIDDLINLGFVNKSLQERKNAQLVYKLLCDVRVCDPAIGSGAFPMGILDILYTTRRHLYGFLGIIEPFNPVEVKKSIIKENIFGVDIEQGAVDIARLRFWLAILVEEVEPSPLPNLDYRIVRGNSLLTTFNDVYIDLSYTTDKRTKLIRLKSELFELKEKLYCLNGDEKFECEIAIKNKILEIVKYQLNKDMNQALEGGAEKIDIFKNEHISEPEKKKRDKAKTVYSTKVQSLINMDALLNKLNSTNYSLMQRAQTDLDFFDWEIIFSEVFNDKGFDIVIGNPPYGVSIKGEYRENVVMLHGRVPDFEIYYYFIEIASKLLRKGGIMSYIIPNTYLFNTYAANYRISILNKWKIHEILDCTKFSIFHSAIVRNTINLWQLSEEHSSIGYRNTSGVASFEELLSHHVEFLSKDNLLKLNQNWGLAFSLNSRIIGLINKISSNISLSSFFPEISQGLIAYDKYRGQDEYTIKNRIYHSFINREGLKRWLYGEDVNRYILLWNGKEYIDYCSGLANPREPKYFKGRRLLIREITNPSIYAVITDEEFYNDPAIIIVKDNIKYSIKCTLAILNSKLATFYHFNHSPKATKGAFPKILVQDIKEFPIPNINDKYKERLEILVDEILRIKNNNKDSETYLLENEIDFIVYKLYKLNYDEILIIDPETSITKEEYEAMDN